MSTAETTSSESQPAPKDSGEMPLLADNKSLSQWLGEARNEGRVARTRLKASERVIARVTDGIYRQPASALRELISNAWDADAKQVSILTDAPRFSRIYVRDDGAGMSYQTLSRLLHSIGGSAKRREEGQELGVTAKDDADRTPKGRLLIGKIGIGLFSVSQLARRFQIVTKVKGESYRLVADVRLRQYSEDDDDDDSREADDSFISGDVYIKREHADDIEAHGTDVVLEDVKPRVRDLLRSADRWRAVDVKETAIAAGDAETAATIRVEPPIYHAGWIANMASSAVSPDILDRKPNLPWAPTDPADIRMGKLVDAVEREFTKFERPDLATTLDTYLELIWTLALSVPIKYVDKHPFELKSADCVRLFWISNEPRGQAQELNLSGEQTIREAVKEQVRDHPELRDGSADPAGGFKVMLDGIELKRPIRFKFIRTDRRGLDKTMMFVGKYNPDLDRVNKSQRGGDLELEGYLFWNGRVVPKENNGVLIRIRGSSGALFDPTFFKYQVSEQTRLRQITSELFIVRGLDAALNIDRESFNFSHPHVQLVTIWLHKAIRQLTNKHKDLSGRVREGRRSEEVAMALDAVASHAEKIWHMRKGLDSPPEVAFEPDVAQAQRAREQGYVAFSRNEIPSLQVRQVTEKNERDSRAKALVNVLSAFNILEDRSYEEQQLIIDAILRIFYETAQ